LLSLSLYRIQIAGREVPFNPEEGGCTAFVVLNIF
jgi:hypothetical protein